MKTPFIKKSLLEVFSEIFSLFFHVIDKIESSWVFVRILGGVVLDSLVNEGDFLGICDGHFNNNNKLRVFENDDELIMCHIEF